MSEKKPLSLKSFRSSHGTYVTLPSGKTIDLNKIDAIDPIKKEKGKNGKESLKVYFSSGVQTLTGDDVRAFKENLFPELYKKEDGKKE